MNYVDNITITGANLAPNSVSSTEIIDGSITSADIANNSIQQNDLANNSVGTSELQNNSVTTAKISNNAVNNSKLAPNSVDSGNIINNEITNADINASAGIASSKLQSTVMVESENVSLLNNDAGYLTSVNSADITDGSIVNADVNAGAAIDGTKINPAFGTQNIQTTGTFNSGAATVSSLTVTNLAASTDTYTGDGATNSFTISAAGAFSSSDVRLKKDINDIDNPLESLKLVEGKRYLFKDDAQKQVHFGVIAQDIQKLFPHLVHENEEGYLSVNYLELIPVLIEAVKEQQITIEKFTEGFGAGTRNQPGIESRIGETTAAHSRSTIFVESTAS